MILPIAVIAGSPQEFEFFLQTSVPHDQVHMFKYIHDPMRARGIRFSTFITIGSWYEKKDRHDLIDVIRANVMNNS